MTELEKIAHARILIDKLANGINPLDDKPIPDGDISKNSYLSQCFSYVSDVLGQLVENSVRKAYRAKKPRRIGFRITDEQLQGFQYSQEPISFSEFCGRLESLVDLSKMRRISRASLPKWFVHLGFLQPPTSWSRHCAGGPTEEGLKMGIAQATYNDTYGTHTINVLSIEAQKFIIDNLNSFLAFRERSRLWIKTRND